MFNLIFEKLNVDISKLPNGEYYVGLQGVDRAFTLDGGGTFYLTLVNGAITNASPEAGDIKAFPGDTSTYYCNVGLTYFYKSS